MRRGAVRTRLVGLLLVGVFLVIMNVLGWLRPVKSVAAYLTRPFQGLSASLGGSVGNALGVVGSASQLAKQNAQLQAEVASLREQVSQDAELRAQNDLLRTQLGLQAATPGQTVAAEVIGYQPDNFRQFITISRGSNDGLHSGMAVVYQGELVGITQDVAATSSKVFLVIDPNFRLAALDQDQDSRPSGVVRGQLGGGMQMDDIAQTEQVKPGDTVVTSGLGSAVPKGLVMGHVQSVDRRDNGVFQSAQVTTDVPFNRLEVVFVVVKQ